MKPSNKIKEIFNVSALLGQLSPELVALKIEKAAALNIDYLKLHADNPRLKIDGADRFDALSDRKALLAVMRDFKKITGKEIKDSVRDSFIAGYKAEDTSVECAMNVEDVWGFSESARKAAEKNGGYKCNKPDRYTSDDSLLIASNSSIAHHLNWSSQN